MTLDPDESMSPGASWADMQARCGLSLIAAFALLVVASAAADPAGLTLDTPAVMGAFLLPLLGLVLLISAVTNGYHEYTAAMWYFEACRRLMLAALLAVVFFEALNAYCMR